MPASAVRWSCCSTQDDDLALTRGLAAGGCARCRRHDRGALGLQPRRAGRRRHWDPADHPMVLRAAAHRRRRRSAWSALPRRRTGRRSIRRRAPCWTHWSEQTAAALERASLAREMVSAQDGHRNRARAQYVARIGLARFPHAAVIDPGLRHQPDRATATSSIRPAKKDLLGQIKTEAEDLDEMVRNLLAITRIDAGALELRRDWIDLREVAERVVSAARRHGARQRIDVRFAARPAAGAGRRNPGRAGDRQCRRQCGRAYAGRIRMW